MKKIIVLSFAAVITVVSCKKESLSPVKSDSQVESTDFVGSINMNAEEARNTELSKTAMKIAIRKVRDKENTYTLQMKIDSVLVEFKNSDGVPQFKMIALDEFDKVSAGLAVLNPENSADKKLIFGKEGMRIHKLRENGRNIYVSDAFQTDVDFDYELVEVSYGIIGMWSFDDAHPLDNSSKEIPFSVEGSHTFLIQPNGKSVYQLPTLEKAIDHGKWMHISGQEFAKMWVITIANDPAQEVEKLIFVPEPVKVETKNPKEPYTIIQLPSISFDKTFFNQKQGVARFSSGNRIEETYADDKTPWQWTGSGAIYSINKGGKPGRICDFNLVRGPLNWK